MEQTLGKRIMSHRKRLGLTQDQLAEKLGVTAQAVSKWENDQSCPDITMLPKLAAIFGITADALLGMEAPVVHEAEVVTIEEEKENQGIHLQKGSWEMRWDGGRKSALAMAIFVLLVGILYLTSIVLQWNVSFWGILWPSALLVFGIFNLLSGFSCFHLGCALFGGYFLLNNFTVLPFHIGGDLVFPVIIVLFGLSLLIDALKKPEKSYFHIHNKNNKKVGASNFSMNEENGTFQFEGSFCEEHQRIPLSRLNGGRVEISFGEFTVDLSEVEDIGEHCRLEANCSFGELCIRVPSRYHVRLERNTAFASTNIKGTPDPAPAGYIDLEADVSFGEVTVKYV